jgi:outer membrane protein
MREDAAMNWRSTVLFLTISATAFPAGAQNPLPCRPDEICFKKQTADDVLRLSATLVQEKKFDQVKPLLAALAQRNELPVERQFLEGYVAVEEGDFDTAVKRFRSVLGSRPDLTRARLELARALFMQKRYSAADYHFARAQGAPLPMDIQLAVTDYRSMIRARKPWSFGLQFGIAPDSNINQGTSSRTVDLFGLPFELADSARKRSGLGQTIASQAAVRLRMAPLWDMTVQTSARMVNFSGKSSDDFIASAAVGPETKLGDWRIGLAATGAQRWYGGSAATRLMGVRLGASRSLGASQQIDLSLHGRKVENFFNNGYDGWQLGATADYAFALGSSWRASVGLFGKYEPLQLASLSNHELGVNLGMSAELPWGLNTDVSAQASRLWFHAALPAFAVRRDDWRVDVTAQIGLRTLRLGGFSPAVAYSFSMTESDIPLYAYDRHRFQFTVARYF